MMIHKLTRAVALAVITTALAAPTADAAATVRADVSFEGPVQLTCPYVFPRGCGAPEPGNEAYATVRLPAGDIEKLCIEVHFEGDLMEPWDDRGDRLEITYPGTWGYGATAWTGPRKRVEICLVAGYRDADIAPFEDGEERIGLFMAEGAATLADVEVRARYSAA